VDYLLQVLVEGMLMLKDSAKRKLEEMEMNSEKVKIHLAKDTHMEKKTHLVQVFAMCAQLRIVSGNI